MNTFPSVRTRRSACTSSQTCSRQEGNHEFAQPSPNGKDVHKCQDIYSPKLFILNNREYTASVASTRSPRSWKHIHHGCACNNLCVQVKKNLVLLKAFSQWAAAHCARRWFLKFPFLFRLLQKKQINSFRLSRMFGLHNCSENLCSNRDRSGQGRSDAVGPHPNLDRK